MFRLVVLDVVLKENRAIDSDKEHQPYNHGIVMTSHRSSGGLISALRLHRSETLSSLMMIRLLVRS